MLSALTRWLFSPRGVAATVRRRRHRISIEALEERRLLSGNVTASISSGQLTITGDSAANSIQIGISGGSMVLTGLNGTTINGASTAFTIASAATTFTGNVTTDLGGGDDAIYFTDGVAITGNIRVIDLGGSNLLAFRGVTVTGNVIMGTGDGADSFSADTTTISGDLKMETGKGADLVSLLSTTVQGLTSLDTGRQGDNVVVDSCTLKNLAIKTGAGADNALVRSTTITGGFSSKMGSGGDYLQVRDTKVTGGSTFKGQGGGDSIVLDGTNTFTGGTKQRSMRDRSSDTSLINAKLNDATTGLLTLATGVRSKVTAAVGAAAPALTTDTSGNAQTSQSNNTSVTRLSSFVITGTTAAGASITVDANNDGNFNDATATADSSGHYSVTVSLADGLQAVKVKSTATGGASTTKEVDVYKAVGTVVQFTSSLGNFDVELLDTDAPLTVANFLSYLSSYANSIIHRSTSQTSEGLSVIQGGGFVYNSSASDLTAVATTAPVTNEFDAANSNVAGTLALALPSGNINGGTSQWFINVADNSSIDSGKYTVFGKVIGDGLNVVTAIHNLTTYDIDPLFSAGNGSLGTVPLNGYNEFTQVLTGSASAAASSTTVQGVGTLFTTELAVGSQIQLGGVTRTVASIASDTELTVTQAYTSAVVDNAPRTEAKPTGSQFVLFSSIAKILT